MLFLLFLNFILYLPLCKSCQILFVHTQWCKHYSRQELKRSLGSLHHRLALKYCLFQIHEWIHTRFLTYFTHWKHWWIHLQKLRRQGFKANQYSAFSFHVLRVVSFSTSLWCFLSNPLTHYESFFISQARVNIFHKDLNIFPFQARAIFRVKVESFLLHYINQQVHTF